MISSVAVLAYEGVSAFGLGVTSEVFGCDRSADGLPRYDYAVTAQRPGLVRTDTGLPVLVEQAWTGCAARTSRSWCAGTSQMSSRRRRCWRRCGR